MKRFLIYILCIGLPLFGAMAAINYVVDPANAFSSEYVEKVVAIMKQGHNVTNITNLNERQLKQAIAAMHKGEHFDYVIIGNSRIMLIAPDMFDNKKVLNMGVSQATMKDIVIIYEMCKENNITADNIVIGVDPYLFNDNDPIDSWKDFKDYYVRFTGDNVLSFNTTRLETLIDPSYLHTSITGMFKDKEVVATDNTVNKQWTYSPYGALYYEDTKGKLPQSDIDNMAKFMKLGKNSYNTLDGVSGTLYAVFQKLIDDSKERGSRILFYKMPYHPLRYRIYMTMAYIPEQEAAIDKLAKTNGLQEFGSYDPAYFGFKNTDFYDGHHPRREAIAKIVKWFTQEEKNP